MTVSAGVTNQRFRTVKDFQLKIGMGMMCLYP